MLRWTVVVFCILAMVAMFLFVRGTSTEVQADPIGPPTIEVYLANIDSNMNLIKWMGGALTGMLTLIGSLLVYIWKITIANIKSSIRHVEENLKEDIEKNDKDIDHIKENFMSIKSHGLICRYPKETS